VPQQSGDLAANFIRIKVSVYYNGIQVVELNRLISK
jgi:hypothetical protein